MGSYGHATARDIAAFKRGKSQVVTNYEQDPTYCPYCLRCTGLQRMVLVAPYHWKCPKCPAQGDCREEHEQFLHRGFIPAIEEHVRTTFEKSDDPCHDWQHIDRVRKLAIRIAEKELANVELVEAAALLHDVYDYKLPMMQEHVEGHQRTLLMELLGSYGLLTQKQQNAIADIVCSVTFKGAGVPDNPPSLEAKCVMDADRLDAMGAIGIARCFAYGGHKGRTIFLPGEEPQSHSTFESYRANTSCSFNHFFEKLLLLQERLQTGAAKALGEERHMFMKRYVSRFLAEIYEADPDEAKATTDAGQS